MFIRTDNLLLRPGWVEDAPALAAAFGRGKVVMTLASAPSPYVLDDAAAYLGLPRTAHEADLLIFLRESGTPRLIGGIGLAQGDGGIELSFWIAPSHWGQGFATEAGHAVIAAARDSLRVDRLISGHCLDNPASGAVLRKLGFAPTGLAQSRKCRARGELACTTYLLELTAPLAMAA